MNAHVPTNEPVFLVTGATGHVGGSVVRALRAKGARVRCATRDRPRADDLGESVPLDFEQPTSFSKALSGVDSVFLMRPPPIFRVGPTLNRFLDVAVASGVSSCTFLSVAGAEGNKLVPHRRVEDHLRTLPLEWTILRPGFFAQNFIDAYRQDILRGELVLPAGDAKVAFVDTADLGGAAARVMLTSKDHAGREYELTGSKSYSFSAAMVMLSTLLHRPIRYRSATPLSYWMRLLRAGSSPLHATILTAINAGLRDGSAAKTTPDLVKLLGRPATGLEAFFRANLDKLGCAAAPGG